MKRKAWGNSVIKGVKGKLSSEEKRVPRKAEAPLEHAGFII